VADVFISYSRSDKAFVTRLAGALSDRGNEVWVCSRSGESSVRDSALTRLRSGRRRQGGSGESEKRRYSAASHAAHSTMSDARRRGSYGYGRSRRANWTSM
jgi:hypothetical protein